MRLDCDEPHAARRLPALRNDTVAPIIGAMSVRSTTFGSVRLTANDARKFRAQVTYGQPKRAAVESLERGRPLADAFVRDGFAPLKRQAR